MFLGHGHSYLAPELSHTCPPDGSCISAFRPTIPQRGAQGLGTPAPATHSFSSLYNPHLLSVNWTSHAHLRTFSLAIGKSLTPCTYLQEEGREEKRGKEKEEGKVRTGRATQAEAPAEWEGGFWSIL